MDIGLLRAVQILALESAEGETYDGFYRQIARWYSKTFHTPLDTVLNDLPQHDVLMVYYEEIFAEALDAAGKNEAAAQQWRQLRARVLGDPEKVAAQDQALEDSDEALARRLAEDIAKDVIKKAADKAARKVAAEQVSVPRPRRRGKTPGTPGEPAEKPNIQQETPPLESKVVAGEADIPPE